VTEFNKTRADLLTEMIRDQRVLVPIKAPKGYAQETVNPYFLAVLRQGNTAREQLANAQALVDALEEDDALRRLAADQRIEVEELRDMISDAEQDLKEDPYPSAEQGENDA
jgi:hypothetical protein